MKNKPVKIILHHTADASTTTQLTKVNDYHKKKQFPKSALNWFVGYHYFLDRDTILTQTRQDSDEGAHCRGQNFNSISLGVAGNYNTEKLSNYQINRIANWCREKMRLYKIPITRIYGHRQFRNTSCPGANFSIKTIQYKIISLELSKIAKILWTIQIKLQSFIRG